MAETGVCNVCRAVWMFGETCDCLFLGTSSGGTCQQACCLTTTEIKYCVRKETRGLMIYRAARLQEHFWLFRCLISGHFCGCISVAHKSFLDTMQRWQRLRPQSRHNLPMRFILCGAGRDRIGLAVV